MGADGGALNWILAIAARNFASDSAVEKLNDVRKEWVTQEADATAAAGAASTVLDRWES